MPSQVRSLGCDVADILSRVRSLGCDVANIPSRLRSLGCDVTDTLSQARSPGCDVADTLSQARSPGCDVADTPSRTRRAPASGAPGPVAIGLHRSAAALRPRRTQTRAMDREQEWLTGRSRGRGASPRLSSLSAVFLLSGPGSSGAPSSGDGGDRTWRGSQRRSSGSIGAFVRGWGRPPAHRCAPTPPRLNPRLRPRTGATAAGQRRRCGAGVSIRASIRGQR